MLVALDVFRCLDTSHIGLLAANRNMNPQVIEQ